MHVTIRWHEGTPYVAETGSGHAFIIDAAPEAGGRNLGPRPMETVLAGTGACSAVDVVTILKSNNQAVTGCEVSLQAERAEKDPKVFTRIRWRFTVRGRDLKEKLVKQAVELSAKKYCSASAMLAKTAEMDYEITLVDEAAPQPQT